MYHPRLKGTHYDMGLKYGTILLKNGIDFNSIIHLTPEQIEFGKESLAICEDVIPDICKEIKGLADGLNMSYSVIASWLLCMYGFGDIHGCSCFCYKENEIVYLCRNSDMFPDLKNTSESILYRPDNKYMFIGHTTSLIQMEDGINQHGLAAGINFLMTKKYKPGLNTGLIVRHILETCKSVNEAVDLIKHLPIATTQNIILADKTGNMAVVECNPEKVIVRTPKNNTDYLISTNHFVSASMKKEHANPMDNWYYSEDRYSTIENAFSQNDREKDYQWAEDVLSGKYGFTCQSEKKLNFQTLWSVVYNLTDLKIFCAEGSPNRTKYKEDTRLKWGMR